MPKNRDKFKKATLVFREVNGDDSKNAFGVPDPTPKEAIRNIKGPLK